MRLSDTRAIEAFWQTVVLCMNELFETPLPIAKRKCGELRGKIDDDSERGDPETVHSFYHAEPIDVAMDLAGATDLTRKQRVMYVEIQRQRMVD